MSSVRCISISVGLFRKGACFSLPTQPGLHRFLDLTFSKHSFKSCCSYGNDRRSIITKGQYFKEVMPISHLNTYTCHRTKPVGCRLYSTQTDPPPPTSNVEPPKLSLLQRYKKMLKEYWYVLLPVHCVTSVVWFGSFYYAATCGVDIVPLLEYLGVSETLIKPLRSSSLGHIAVASAFYKLASPARYAVTLGGTTLAVKFLTKRGLIKPMPSKERMKEMVKKKTDDFIQRKTTQQ